MVNSRQAFCPKTGPLATSFAIADAALSNFPMLAILNSAFGSEGIVESVLNGRRQSSKVINPSLPRCE
jgi:hypothetical protein